MTLLPHFSPIIIINLLFFISTSIFFNFYYSRRFQTIATTTSNVWQSLSTSVNGCLHRERYVSALSALTTLKAHTMETDGETKEKEHSTTTTSSPAMSTPVKQSKTKAKKKFGFMGRLQKAAKAKVMGGVDLTRGGFEAVTMPTSAVDAETWFVTSRVMFCENPGQWYQVRSSRGHVWCEKEQEPMQATSATPVAPMEFVFVGPQVETYVTDGSRTNYKRAVVEMLVSCQPPLPSKKTQRTRRMLKQKEITTVNDAHKELSAGDGWYHDGRTYIGPTGNSSNSHPRLEEFLNEYLIEQNEEIEIYNNSVQSRRLRR